MRSSRKLRIVDALVALLVVGIVVFAAVGPLSDNPPPTRKQYVAKADEVCTDIELEQARLDNTIFKGIPFDESPPPHLYVKYVKALIPTYRKQLATLRKITPPKGDERKLRRYFTAIERIIAFLEEIAADPKKVSRLSDTRVFDAADAAARDYDLVSCGHVED